MIVPDINLLVYAYNSDAPDHERARTWWEASLSAPQPVGLAWAVMLGYLRLMTSRSVLIDPFLPAEAIGHIRSWLARHGRPPAPPDTRFRAALSGNSFCSMLCV